MKTENISTLKINKLTQEQYDTALADGVVEDKAVYLVPDEEADTSDSVTADQLNAKLDTSVFETYKSDVQASLDNIDNNKQDKINGAASTITSNNLTADRVLVSDASGKVGVSDATSTEVGYLSGTTSSIQEQLNNKASSDSLSTHINNADLHFTEGERDSIDQKIATAQATAISTAGSNAETKINEAVTSVESTIDTKIAALVNSAPETMDTLGELATAISEHKDVTNALDKAISTKADATDLTSHTNNTENPHSVTAAQVGLGNVPNVATNDQAPTYSAASTLSALTSGEKLSVAFGKIKTAVSNLISHIGNTSNPHSVTKSQIGLGNVDNTSDQNKPISDAMQEALDGKSNSGHTHAAVTTTAKGLMLAADKAKLDGVTESADAVSFTRSLTTGTKVGTININGTDTILYAPTNTHYISGTVVGKTSTATADASATNGNVYLNHVENSSVVSSHKISGTGATSVTSDSSGNITVSSTNTTYGVATSSTLGLVKSGTDITVDSSGNVSVNDDSHNHTISNIDDLQSTLDGKQATITGGATTIASSNLTTSRALVSNSSGKVAVSAVTSTELGYLDGVTSSVQTQLDAKASSSHSHSVATTSANGFMSSSDKAKLDGIASGANAYSHPTYTSKASGLYKVTVDSTGHVSGATAVTKSDITALGIPAQDTNTTYSNATTSTAGLLSAADKAKLDGITSSADSVTFSRNLTSGTQIGTITINGTNTAIYAPTDTNTHYTSGTIVGSSSTATANAAVTSGNAVYLNHIENGSVRNSHKISGDGDIGIWSDANGNITIRSEITTHSHAISDITDLQTNLNSINTNLGGKMSSSNPTGTGYFSLNRSSGSTVGAYSFTEGYSNTASANYSHAEGVSSTASGSGSHAEGQSTTASGTTSHAEGTLSTASGNYSHAEGYNTNASGNYSHAEGSGSVASGYCSHAGGCDTNANENYAHSDGYSTTANQLQYVIGQYNKSYIGSNVNSQTTSDSQTLFIVGNGTSSSGNNAFRISSSGKCFGSSAFNASGADFAELFEWADGNVESADRRGLFVKLNGEKIELANAGDDYIGIVSGTQAFVGNSASEDWHGKYVTDIFGEKITQEVEIPEHIDEATGKTIPAHTVTQFVINPDYDPDEEYVSRENRKEWGVVGLLGQVVVVDDGTCEVNGYCEPSVNGIATASENGYRVMKRIDDTHIKVLVR